MYAYDRSNMVNSRGAVVELLVFIVKVEITKLWIIKIRHSAVMTLHRKNILKDLKPITGLSATLVLWDNAHR